MRVFQAQTCESKQNAGKERFDKFACLLFNACVNKRFRGGLKAKSRQQISCSVTLVKAQECRSRRNADKRVQ